LWLMLLYDYFFWIGSIDERPVSEREADDANRANSTTQPEPNPRMVLTAV